jgi:hypothetical protein
MSLRILILFAALMVPAGCGRVPEHQLSIDTLVPPFMIAGDHYTGIVFADADLWYDRELGRFGHVGMRVSDSPMTLYGADRARFEAWLANRKRPYYAVARGNGVFEIQVPEFASGGH